MPAVKKAEAYAFLSELKTFAFNESPGLKAGTQSGFEVNTSFYYKDPVPYELAYKISREMCKSSFGFVTFRVPPVKNKPSYSYTLTASVVRTLPAIPKRVYDLLPETTKAGYDWFAEIEEGALCEASSIALETSDHEVGKVDTNQSYSITYGDETIYEITTQDVLYGVSGESVAIAPIESVDDADRHFIPAFIEHERLEPAENVIANLGFWAIVDPESDEALQGISYGSAVSQMRGIMRALTTGFVE